MSKIPFGWRLWLLLLLFLAWPAFAAEQVTVERDSPLYAEPRADASQVTQLKQGTVAEVLSRNGAWLNLKTGAATGWTYTFNVRFPSQAGGQSTGSSSTLGRLFAPRSTSVATTSTIGIRGLDETDLRQATFNPDQMRLLDEYAANRESAQSQAAEGGLTPARIDYLSGGRPK